MRRAALLVVLAACSAKAPDAHITAVPSATPTPVVDAGVAAAPVEAVEAPLAWGTRPAKTGPLFPVVDGMCIHMEAWPFDDGGAYVTYGNVGGGYNRGSMHPTGVRLTDDGLDLAAPSYSPLNPVWMAGSWSGVFAGYTNLPSRIGMGTYAVEWHDANGWKTLAQRTDGDPNKPSDEKRTYVAQPVLFQGHVVFAKATDTDGTSNAYALSFQAVPPLPGIAGLNATVRFEFEHSLVAGPDAIYETYTDEQNGQVLREWKDGKVTRIAMPGAAAQIRANILATTPNLVVKTDKVWERIGGKFEEIPFPAGQFTSVQTAPNGDLWLMGEKSNVLVARAGEGGRHTKVESFPLPKPATPRALNKGEWSSVAGGYLAGAAFDDIYAIGDGGSLFHRENDAWKEVAFPKPPFSTNQYRADSIAMKAKGDLFVNASYSERGEGWNTAERYRAILRTKRPKETFRCNEPNYGDTNGSGSGFMSFPPLADDTCKTPFVVIVRTWYAKGSDDYRELERRLHDAKSDFPTIRASIKALPALGETIELVDLRAGNQGYLGAAVPSVAVGHDFIKELAKRVVALPELRPELVCGTPEKVISRRTVNVTSGAWVK